MRPPPLLSFPPDERPPYAATVSQNKPRSRLYKVMRLIPLIVIYCILFFGLYAYSSLAVSHLILSRDELLKGFGYGAMFLVLEGATAVSLWRAAFSRPEGFRDDLENGGSGRREEIAEDDRPLMSRPEESSGEEEDEDEDDEDGDDQDEDGVKSRSSNLVPRDEWAPRSDRGIRRQGERGMSLGDVLMENNRDTPASIQLKSNGQPRFCRKCQKFKPDRAHHCSACKSCVLKMDHHCPWLGGGCVGYHNYKFFLLFLLYGGALGLFVCVTMLLELSNYVAGGGENYSLAPISWAVAMLLGGILGLSLTAFGSYHFYLAATNRTTIEAMERSPTYAIHLTEADRYTPSPSSSSPYIVPMSRAKRRALERELKRINIYDVGVQKNLESVLGTNWYEWAVPFGRTPGDGVSFPINHEEELKIERILRELRSANERNRFEEGVNSSDSE